MLHQSTASDIRFFPRCRLKLQIKLRERLRYGLASGGLRRNMAAEVSCEVSFELRARKPLAFKTRTSRDRNRIFDTYYIHYYIYC